MTAHVPFRPRPGAATKSLLGSFAGAQPVPDYVDAELAGNRDLALIAAVRLYRAGEIDLALTAVADLLAVHPDWVEAHIVMAQLIGQSGGITAFEEFLTNTIRSAKGDVALTVAALRQLSEAGCHALVEAQIPLARTWAGDHLFFTLLEAITASELGDLARADICFAAARKQGGLLSLPHVRHLIRKGDASQAATLAQAFVQDHPRHQGGWGLLGTAWRMMGDSRHEWLVDRPGLVRSIDLDLMPGLLEGLATTLRGLHVARHQPVDQSLRGGTQTNGTLLDREDPAIRLLRSAMQEAVRTYVDGLPAFEEGHPLLGCDRDSFRFSDSWSVRLLDGGYHVSHFHPQGTISSAFYVSLPQLGGSIADLHPHAGWLTIGEPPANLGTNLPPLELVEPRVGRLALFPSFLWHGTRPFPRGERLTVAFDTVLGG